MDEKTKQKIIKDYEFQVEAWTESKRRVMKRYDDNIDKYREMIRELKK